MFLQYAELGVDCVLFSAHADVAAEAGSQQLPAQRLAQILSSGGKGVKINRETADYVANVWVDYALFGQAVVHGKLPLDSKIFLTPPNSIRLSWQSSAGGSWGAQRLRPVCPRSNNSLYCNRLEFPWGVAKR